MPVSNETSETNPTQTAPPIELSFWELFDYFWARGLGNQRHTDGTATPWTATSLENAFDGSPDKRSIENWQSQNNMPSPENIRKLSWVIAGDDKKLRRAWYEALIAARLREKRKERALAKSAPEKHLTESQAQTETTPSGKPKKIAGLVAIVAAALATAGWFMIGTTSASSIENLRICDAPYFDDETKDCTQHVSVFVHGIDEVFLSFDFKNVADGTPFDRWWILNGERIAGRTSFNDEAWPGYTFWRPGVLEVGQYVVRVVVEGQVFTQTFFVQPDGFVSKD